MCQVTQVGLSNLRQLSGGHKHGPLEMKQWPLTLVQPPPPVSWVITVTSPQRHSTCYSSCQNSAS